MQPHLHLWGFQSKKGNPFSILIQSVLDEQLLFSLPFLNTTCVFLFKSPPKYENPSHFLSTTNPSDQYNKQFKDCELHSTNKPIFMLLNMNACARVVQTIIQTKDLKYKP